MMIVHYGTQWLKEFKNIIQIQLCLILSDMGTANEVIHFC